jgi:hypothetical protein
MDPIFAPVIGLVSVGILVLVGMKMRYDYRAKQLTAGAGKDALDRLESQLDAVREQVLALRDEVGELYERVEFAERMLARGKSDRALGPADDA